MNLNIKSKPLPVNCYASSNTGYTPKAINATGIVQHYFSCIYTEPDNAYDLQRCWELMHDLNFEKKDRLYSIYEGPRVPVSAHYLVGREGEIWRLVPEDYQAWHAGVSEHEGRPGCNRFMFGIENIGSEGVPFTDEQYDSNAELCAYLMGKYNISIDDIVGHDQVALPTGRKKDPGPLFNWGKLRDLIVSKVEG